MADIHIIRGRVYLIAHTNRCTKSERKDSGVAQAPIHARTRDEAREHFAQQYPNRDIVAVGIRGVAW